MNEEGFFLFLNRLIYPEVGVNNLGAVILVAQWLRGPIRHLHTSHCKRKLWSPLGRRAQDQTETVETGDWRLETGKTGRCLEI